ncbi:MAG: ATP-binding protein, partial [Phormidesmis sp.]
SLYKLSQEIVQELKPLADEKGVTLSIVAETNRSSSETESYKTKGDVIELRRLLTNLVGNAIKFTDSGSIEVSVSVKPAKNEPSSDLLQPELIDVAITDTGPGIAPEEQEEIFEWFFQGDHMRAGSGLGLHLSKRIAELHQGSLSLESEVGKGSTFTLSLPKLKDA